MKSTATTSTRSGSSSAASGLQLTPAAAGTRTYQALTDRLSWASLLRLVPARSPDQAEHEDQPGTDTGLELASSTGAAGDLEQLISAIGRAQINCYSATAKVAKIEVKSSTYMFKTETYCTFLSDVRR